MISRASIRLTLGSLISLAPALLEGQDARPISLGDEIRVTLTTGKERLRGTFAGQVADTIEVHTRNRGQPKAVRVPIGHLKRIEIAAGRRHPVGQGLLIGAAIGAATGALAGLVAPICTPSGFLDCLFEPTSRGEAVGYHTLLVGTGGLLVGGVVGLIGRDAWAPARLGDWSPTVTVGRAGIGIGVAIPIGR